MKIKAKEIELFKDLTQFDIDRGHFYDLHNDFNCVKIVYENKKLSFFFEKTTNHIVVKLIFTNVFLERFDFNNFSKLSNLTLDSLYRGRYEKENQLSEFSDAGKSFFYLEFYEGGKMEFWCDELQVDQDLS